MGVGFEGPGKKILTGLVIVLLLTTSAPLTQAGGGGDDEPSAAVGEFVRLGSEGELTTDHVRSVDGGLFVDGPWLASQVHVNATYLHDQLGDWGADQAYTMDDDRVVVDANDVTFTPFVPGQDAVFTHGSDASIQLQDRPMWVSVWDGGPRSIVLDLDDGDPTGQPVRLAKAWLATHNIHTPRAIHEDGTVIPVEETADGQGFLLDVPHFSTIGIDDPNSAPTADFSYSPGSPTTADNIQFTDDSTDSDGTISAWLWDFGDGDSSTAENPSHSYADDGTYTVKLTVTDDLGATDTVSKSVSIANVPPTSLAISSELSSDTEPSTADLHGSASDSDGTIASYKWFFGDGTSATGADVSHTYDDGGDIEVKLRVTDDDGDSTTTQKTISINHLHPAADYTFSQQTSTEPSTVDFTDTSTHPNAPTDDITGWSWDFGDGTGASVKNSSHTYVDGGDYTVTLTATDDDTQTGTVTQTVSVAHVPPIANFTYTPTPPDVWDTIQFTDASTHPNGLVDSIVAWEWDFGDGNTSTLQSPFHSYATNGTYTVTLTVTDDDTVSHTIQRTLTVKSFPVDWEPIAEFVGLPDPVTWLEHNASGLRYRRTTSAERAANGWVIGSYLVEEGDLANRSSIPGTLQMLFPYNDAKVELFEMKLVGSEVGPASIGLAMGEPPLIMNTTFYDYQANVSQGTGASVVTADAYWGLAGKAAIDDRVGAISGFEETWLTEDITALPGGGPIFRFFLVEFISRLTFEIDAVDAPDNTADHNYGLVGEGKWCETHQGSWVEKMRELARTVLVGFADTAAALNHEVNICHTEFDDLDHAEVCDKSGTFNSSCYYDDTHSYAFNSCNDDASCYATGSGWDIWHTRDHWGHAFDGLDVVNVIHKGTMNHDGNTVCGLGYYSDSGYYAGLGVSSDWINHPGCPDYVATHEIGHNFDATHCDAEPAVPTVMTTSVQAATDDGCPDKGRDNSNNIKNAFSVANTANVDTCAVEEDCPRSERV